MQSLCRLLQRETNKCRPSPSADKNLHESARSLQSRPQYFRGFQRYLHNLQQAARILRSTPEYSHKSKPACNHHLQNN